MYVQRLLTVFCLSLLLLSTSCESDKKPRPSGVTDKPKATTPDPVSTGPVTYKELHRPQYHYTPARNWMDNPCGLVYHDGEYHMFYQHNPTGPNWGNTSWGHAVSKDLLHWEELPVAIPMQDSVMAFSGSVVVDKDNTSGLCPDGNCMVAIFTGHQAGKNQVQNLAYSTDNGRTFKMYEGNPVLDIDASDFRDPNVFWHTPSKQWIMAVNLPRRYKVMFYGSKNLKEWTELGSFGDKGDNSKIWEAPDLFQLQVEGEKTKKWVLLISGGGPKRGEAGMQYFIGNFDGQSFTRDKSQKIAYYVDYGKDFFAGRTFQNEPNDKRIMAGWMNNWVYAEATPTGPFRGVQSLPRELSLRRTAEGLRLVQAPYSGLDSLRNSPRREKDITMVGFEGEFEAVRNKSVEILAEIDVQDSRKVGVKVLRSNEGKETIIGYEPEKEILFLDRAYSGTTQFSNAFGVDRLEAPLKLKDGKLKLHVFTDHSTIEIFANDGERVISAQAFPEENGDRMMFMALSKPMLLEDVRIWYLDSVWE